MNSFGACPRCFTLLAADWYGDPHCWACGFVDYFRFVEQSTGAGHPLHVTTYFLRYRGESTGLRDMLTVATGYRDARGRQVGGIAYDAACPWCGTGMRWTNRESGSSTKGNLGWRNFECPERHSVWLEYKSGAPAGWR